VPAAYHPLLTMCQVSDLLACLHLRRSLDEEDGAAKPHDSSAREDEDAENLTHSESTGATGGGDECEKALNSAENTTHFAKGLAGQFLENYNEA
jgi:hypothetical protein